MAEEHDVERDLPATPRRLEEAREKGQVARSRELAAAASVLAAALAFAWLGPRVFERCASLVRSGLTLDREQALSAPRMVERLATFSLDTLIAFLPLLAALLTAAVAAPLLLSGGVFSWHVVKPDFNRMNPARGLGNMFSAQGAVELAKALLKCVLLGAIGTWALMHYWDGMQTLPLLGTASAAHLLGDELSGTFIALACGLGVIAAIDVPWQLWQHLKQLRMSREEVKQEMRESDGDPQVKAKIRQLQMQALQLQGRTLTQQLANKEQVVQQLSSGLECLQQQYDESDRIADRRSKILAISGAVALLLGLAGGYALRGPAGGSEGPARHATVTGLGHDPP